MCVGKEVSIDRAEIIWPDGKKNQFENLKANNTITAKYSKAKMFQEEKENKEKLFEELAAVNIGLNHIHKENTFDDFKDEILLPHRLSQNGPFSAIGDVNGDGKEDIFIGGAADQSGVLYLQYKSNQFMEADSQPWVKDRASEDLGSLFLDIDGDNDLDLYVASGGSEFKQGSALLRDRLYINNGNGEFVKSANNIPAIAESSECVKASDIDGDGDLDLFVGIRMIPGKYTYPASSYLLINNDGKFNRAEMAIAPSLENIGMVTDAVFSDIDQDGDEDLIIVGEWMGVTVLINDDGNFEDSSEKYGLGESTRGIWWSITAEDLDNDGDDDYILGNLGKNNKFKASEEHPFKVYANDFDDNGTNDIVLAKFYKDDYVPVRGRECTSQQMPYVAEKFEDYHSFASSKLLEILPEDKLGDAVVYEITSFDSVLLFNDNGQLSKTPLPNEVQVSPIKSSIVLDANKDGIKDILVVGNHYGVEVETTRYDAGFGALLLGDKNGNYNFVRPAKSGFYTPYDSRDLKLIKQDNSDLLIVTNNDTKMSVFSTIE